MEADLFMASDVISSCISRNISVCKQTAQNDFSFPICFRNFSIVRFSCYVRLTRFNYSFHFSQHYLTQFYTKRSISIHFYNIALVRRAF